MKIETIDKRDRVWDEPVAELNELAQRWRQGTDGQRLVPWFDPDGPGTTARALVLLQSPAPLTVAAGDLGFSSMDNHDASSVRLRAAMLAAGVDPGRCLRWNAVPWALRSPPGHRAIGIADIEQARPAMIALVDLLPHLRVVVTVGRVALTAWMRYLTLGDSPAVVPTLAVPHPSPANGHRRTESAERLARAMTLTAALIA